MLAIIRKQYLDLQGRLLTYPIFALAVSIFSANPATTYTLMTLAAIALISDLVNQTAGDDRGQGTFEFIFTRAIDRRGYVAAKYFFCLPLVLGFVALCLLFEWLNVRAMFFGLVTEVGNLDLAARLVDFRAWGAAALIAVLLLSIAFFSTITAGAEPAPSSIMFLSVVVTVGYIAAVGYGLTRLLGTPGDGVGLLASNKFAAAFGAALLVPSFIAFTASREHYARRTLPLAGSKGARSRNKGWLGFLVLLAVIAAVAAYLMVSARPVAPTIHP